MATRDYAVLDIQNDDDELQFQDFGLSGNSSTSQTHVFTEFPDSPGHQADTDKLLGEQDDEDSTSAGKEKSRSFWTFSYYQQFFDVDSKQVGDRIMWSMVPKPGVSYLELHVRPKPDLYGPFWVCLTLVFAAAIAGNVSNYLQTQGDQTLHWRYDFHKVSLAAGMVFSYGWLLPLLLWSVLRYKSATPTLSLLDLVCLYGYSLSVLVPVCIVWTVPIVWLRWCVGIVGVVLSGVVLAKAVWEGLKAGGEVVEEDGGATDASNGGVMKKIAMVMVLVVVVMHIAIAMGFMLYFFSEPIGAHKANPLAVVVTSQAPAVHDGNPLPPAAGIKNASRVESDGANKRDVVPERGGGAKGTPLESASQLKPPEILPPVADMAPRGDGAPGGGGRPVPLVAASQLKPPGAGVVDEGTTRAALISAKPPGTDSGTTLDSADPVRVSNKSDNPVKVPDGLIPVKAVTVVDTTNDSIPESSSNSVPVQNSPRKVRSVQRRNANQRF